MASNEEQNSSGTKPSDLPRGLLNKSGTPAGKSARLSSVRIPRDLTLGGSQKKSFKPNLPARREKVASGSLIEEKLEIKPNHPKREKNQNDKGKSRRSTAPTTIQSSSIFEQDLGERVIKRESIYSGSESQRRGTSTVKLSGSREDKAETQKILDKLLRDDFHDDDLADLTEQPVSLPLYNPPKAEQPTFKVESGEEKKPILQSRTDDPFDLSRLLDNTDESMKLILVQIPDEVPGIKSKDDSSASMSQAAPVDNLSHTVDACRLEDLTEGKIGRMRFYRSGRAEIVLGEHTFNINRGVPCGFLQEVVYLNAELEEIASLGPVSDKLIVVPNIDNLLDSSIS